jgi:signal transduction histidine kinase
MTLRWRLLAIAVGIPVLSLTMVGAAQYYVARVYLIAQAAADARQQEKASALSWRESDTQPPMVPGSTTAVYDKRTMPVVVSPGAGRAPPPPGPRLALAPTGAAVWVEPPFASYPNLLAALEGDPTVPVGASGRGSLGPGVPRPVYRLLFDLGLVPTGDYPSFMVLHGPSGDVLLTAATLTRSQVLVAETSLTPVNQELRAELVIFSLASAVALVGVVALALWLTSRALAPLRNVARVANEIGAGAFDRRTGVRGRDEVAVLATAFDGMVDRLQQQMTRVSESEAAMRRFLADASHELRTPVTGMLGHLEVLRRGAADNPEDLHQSLAAMHLTADRMARLVHDLLALSRLDQGEMAVAADPIDIGGALAAAADAAGPSTRHHVLRVALPGEALRAVGDRDAVERILVNLLDNAAKYSPRGTAIEVTARPAGERAVEVLVSDHGPGIPVEDQERVFERFARADRARSRPDSNGAGLGLAISRGLARRQGGDLTVVSAAGRGSTFVLRLLAQPALGDGNERPDGVA